VVITLDPALRKRIIDGINTNLGEFYIDAALASQMQTILRAHDEAGDYAPITDGDVFPSG
jgi:hypothetical protein